MAKLQEIKRNVNGKNYNAYQLSIRPEIVKGAGWKKSDDIDASLDPSGNFVTLKKIRNRSVNT